LTKKKVKDCANELELLFDIKNRFSWLQMVLI